MRRIAYTYALGTLKQMELQLKTPPDHVSCIVVSAAGEIDVVEAPSLRMVLSEVLASDCSRVVVDLSKVTFMDSVGLGVLVQFLKRFSAAEGDMRLVIGEPRVLRAFELTGLASIFSIFESLDLAIA